MKKKDIRSIVIFILLISVVFIAAFTSSNPKHGTIQRKERRTGPSVITIYDADKKRWVEQVEWFAKYGELPIGYLPKEEWDKKAEKLKRTGD